MKSKTPKKAAVKKKAVKKKSAIKAKPKKKLASVVKVEIIDSVLPTRLLDARIVYRGKEIIFKNVKQLIAFGSSRTTYNFLNKEFGDEKDIITFIKSYLPKPGISKPKPIVIPTRKTKKKQKPKINA